MKNLFSRKNGVSSFENEMFPSQKKMSHRYRKNFRQLHVHRFFHHRPLQFPVPLKIAKRTLGKTSFQARTASSLLFFPCRFLSSLIVLFTDHARPLESLNRQEELIM